MTEKTHKTITMKPGRLLFILLALAVCFTAAAQDSDAITVNTKQNKWASSNFFAKGIEAINDEEFELALDMFQREVKQHPSNGYALCNLSQCQFMVARLEMLTSLYKDEGTEEELKAAKDKGSRAMMAALPLLDKGMSKLPSTDTEAQCQAFRLKAALLRNIDSSDSTLIAECYDKAIAVHPCNEAYDDHMDFFVNNTEIITADALALRKLYPDDPSNVKLLAATACRSGDYRQCLAQCEEFNAMLKAHGEDGIDSQIGLLQLVSLNELGREEEAMDLALKFIEEYELNDAVQLFMVLADKNPGIAEIKVKQRLFADNGDNILWYSMLGHIMETKKDYASALQYFKTVEKTEKEAYVFNEISKCYYMLVDTDNALRYIEAATIMDGGDEYLSERDVMLVNLGMASTVISEKMTGLEIVKNIDETAFFERTVLAGLLLQEHDYAQAATILEPLLEQDDDASALLLYATALKGLGRDDEAQRRLQQITEINPMPESAHSSLIPALYATGHSEEALNLANSMARQWENHQLNPDGDETPESCYIIATVFAQIGESDKALEYLEKHFLHDSMPYNFGFIDRDWRLDSVRELPQYKTLVEKYKKLWKSNAISNK